MAGAVVAGMAIPSSASAVSCVYPYWLLGGGCNYYGTMPNNGASGWSPYHYMDEVRFRTNSAPRLVEVRHAFIVDGARRVYYYPTNIPNGLLVRWDNLHGGIAQSAQTILVNMSGSAGGFLLATDI